MSNSNLPDQIVRAVFIDRDGTLNVEKDYLYRIEEFEFVDGAVEALRLLNQAGFFVVVVTNQSGIARGYYTEEDLAVLHRHVQSLFADEGVRVDAWYYCPHHPEGQGVYRQDCICRKPLPGMLLQAAVEHGIDLTKSWMIGDKLVDVEAGLAAGCRPMLVGTGYGKSVSDSLPASVPFCGDILEAAKLITAV